MNLNSENPGVGKRFQLEVKRWFIENKGHAFILEKKIGIGNPPKLHSFDIADEDGTTVIECKCYTWTETGNVPSAKMGFTNEAAFYLSWLPNDIEKVIVMLKATHPTRRETLAEYYYRTNRHMLGKIKVMEFDLIAREMTLIGQPTCERETS